MRILSVAGIPFTDFYRKSPWILFLLLILLCIQVWAAILFLQYAAKALVNPYPLDYGEGAVLDQAIRLFQGQAIYRVGLDTPPYVINVYPPLYLVAQLAFLKLWGVAFWYGRAISFISTLAVALLIGLTLRQFTRDWLVSIIGGLTFLVIPYVVHWAALFRIDMLALFFSWAALFVIVRWPKARWSFAAATLLLLAAVYTRQSYLLAAPLTAFCWLWVQSGLKRAFIFAALLASLILAMFIALNFVTAGGFFFNTITVLGRQSISLDTVWYYADELVRRLPLLLIAAGALFVIAFTKTSERYFKTFLVPYLLGASISALTIGKPGSNVNYLLELVVALSLSGAIMLLWLRRWPWLHLLGLVLLGIQICALMQWTQTDYFSSHYAEPHAESQQLLQLIHQTQGPVLTDEYIGLLLLDHRPVLIQPFDFSVLSKNGLWDQQPFLDTLDKRTYALIIIYNPYDALVKQRWTKQMLQHIRQNYELVEHIENNEIYRRRP